MDHQLDKDRLRKWTVYFFVYICYNNQWNASVAELADALDLGSSAVRRAGSIPVTRTNFKFDGELTWLSFLLCDKQ